MKTLRNYFIGFIWLPIIGLAAWWAGFMPFPTRPAEVGLHGFSFNGLPDVDQEPRHLISVTKAKDQGNAAPYGLGAWYCGKDQKPGLESDPKHCQIYEVREEPFFGWVSPRWVLTVNTMKGVAAPVSLYGTYAACKWNEERSQKAYDVNRVNDERWAIEQHQKIETQEREFFSCERIPE